MQERVATAPGGLCKHHHLGKCTQKNDELISKNTRKPSAKSQHHNYCAISLLLLVDKSHTLGVEASSMQSTQLLPHAQSYVKISVNCYRELLQKLRQQQATSVEDSSLLFQQARQQVLRNLRARLHAHAITVDPKRAFRRLKQRAANVGTKLATFGAIRARRARSTYEAAYRRITQSGPVHQQEQATQLAATQTDQHQQQLHGLMHANPFFRVCCVGGGAHEKTHTALHTCHQPVVYLHTGTHRGQCGHCESCLYAWAHQHNHP